MSCKLPVHIQHHHAHGAHFYHYGVRPNCNMWVQWPRNCLLHMFTNKYCCNCAGCTLLQCVSTRKPPGSPLHMRIDCPPCAGILEAIHIMLFVDVLCPCGMLISPSQCLRSPSDNNGLFGLPSSMFFTFSFHSLTSTQALTTHIHFPQCKFLSPCCKNVSVLQCYAPCYAATPLCHMQELYVQTAAPPVRNVWIDIL